MINFYGYQNLEKLRFGESIPACDLLHMVGHKEPLKSIEVGKIYIIKIHNSDELLLGLILKISNDYVYLIDKQNHNTKYFSHGNYSKATEDSIVKIDKLIIEYLATIGSIKDADLLKKYKVFAKEFKDNNKKNTLIIQENIISKHYPIYNTKKDIPENVYAVRSDLLINDEYKLLHDKGVLQILTIIFRLSNTKNADAKRFYDALVIGFEEYLTKYELMDYGYLDSEIIASLTLNKFSLEKHLFVAFLKGHRLFSSVMLELYKNYLAEILFNDKMPYIKIFHLISSKDEYSNEEKQQMKTFLANKIDDVYIDLIDLH